MPSDILEPRFPHVECCNPFFLMPKIPTFRALMGPWEKQKSGAEALVEAPIPSLTTPGSRGRHGPRQLHENSPDESDSIRR